LDWLIETYAAGSFRISARFSFFQCGASSGMSSTVAEYAAVGTEMAAPVAAKPAATPPVSNCRRDAPIVASDADPFTLSPISRISYSCHIRQVKTARLAQ
jgi:hypothetical protein